MKKNKENTNKIKTTKTKLALRIMGVILVALMLLSVCAPCVFYAMAYFGA